jgi:hypothetical protein
MTNTPRWELELVCAVAANRGYVIDPGPLDISRERSNDQHFALICVSISEAV